MLEYFTKPFVSVGLNFPKREGVYSSNQELYSEARIKKIETLEARINEARDRVSSLGEVQVRLHGDSEESPLCAKRGKNYSIVSINEFILDLYIPEEGKAPLMYSPLKVKAARRAHTIWNELLGEGRCSLGLSIARLKSLSKSDRLLLMRWLRPKITKWIKELPNESTELIEKFQEREFFEKELHKKCLAFKVNDLWLDHSEAIYALVGHELRHTIQPWYKEQFKTNFGESLRSIKLVRLVNLLFINSIWILSFNFLYDFDSEDFSDKEYVKDFFIYMLGVFSVSFLSLSFFDSMNEKYSYLHDDFFIGKENKSFEDVHYRKTREVDADDHIDDFFPRKSIYAEGILKQSACAELLFNMIIFKIACHGSSVKSNIKNDDEMDAIYLESKKKFHEEFGFDPSSDVCTFLKDYKAQWEEMSHLEPFERWQKFRRLNQERAALSSSK